MSSTPAATPQPPSGSPPTAPPAKGSGAKVFLWVLGGCATIVVLGILVVSGLVWYGVHKAKQAGFDPELMKKNPVLAVAKLSVATNPDTEMVSSDDSSGTIVVRDKKTGKVSTMKVDPDKKTMTVTDENGKTVTMKLDPSTNKLVVTDDTGKTATITADAQAGNLEIKGPDGNFKMGANADKAPSWVPVYPGVTPQNNFSASANGEQTGNYSFVTKDAVDKVLAYYESNLKSAGFKTSSTTNNTNGKLSGLVSGTADNDKRTVVVMAGGEDDGTKVNVSFNSKP
ncbi:MAG TPA: hypothetical protein VKE93_00240 [Candidatus Angelobacter sp.]|nr:hypothetical protein [Candidatus Angelobacter sp.]